MNCTIFDIYNDSTWVISSVNLILSIHLSILCIYLRILGDDAYVLKESLIRLDDVGTWIPSEHGQVFF